MKPSELSKQQVSETAAVLRNQKLGMAHSHIFLCGKSSDAMLATRVSYVIKGKREVVFFLKNSTLGNILQLVTHTLIQEQPKTMGSVRQ